MPLLEPAAFVIVGTYLFFRLWRTDGWSSELKSLGLLSVASWAAEEWAVSLYKFYGYSSAWSVYLGHVPLMVVLIWPVIIHSARDLADQMYRGKDYRMTSALSGGIVLTDSLLIEPVAVRAGLWGWHEPGIFGVPLIGLLGWAYLAFTCVFFLQRMRKGWHRLLVAPAAPAATHLLLLISWWGGLRWLHTALAPLSAVAGAWVLSSFLLLILLRTGAGKRVAKKTLLARIPGALFFFTLLALNARESLSLLAYALAFIPPYLLMMKQQYDGSFSKISQTESQ
jgi:hypothetical protein